MSSGAVKDVNSVMYVLLNKKVFCIVERLTALCFMLKNEDFEREF